MMMVLMMLMMVVMVLMNHKYHRAVSRMECLAPCISRVPVSKRELSMIHVSEPMSRSLLEFSRRGRLGAMERASYSRGSCVTPRDPTDLPESRIALRVTQRIFLGLGSQYARRSFVPRV